MDHSIKCDCHIIISKLELQIKNLTEKLGKYEKNKQDKHNIPLDLSDIFISSIVEKLFTHEYFVLGQRGVANFVYKHILIKDNKLLCSVSNPEKKTISYYNTTGYLEKDPGCLKLFNTLYPPIKKKSRIIYKEYLNKCYGKDHDDSNDGEEDHILDMVIAREVSKDNSNIDDRDDEINNIVKTFTEIGKMSRNRKIFVNTLLNLIIEHGN